ncbi:hypothetical protein [Pigmentiphaga litoralis]|uniref:hypothetical protein n=1 Tax=Pigmentiphaga litoralis TaxID=516702 RepID=UPI003B439C00
MRSSLPALNSGMLMRLTTSSTIATNQHVRTSCGGGEERQTVCQDLPAYFREHEKAGQIKRHHKRFLTASRPVIMQFFRAGPISILS